MSCGTLNKSFISLGLFEMGMLIIPSIQGGFKDHIELWHEAWFGKCVTNVSSCSASWVSSGYSVEVGIARRKVFLKAGGATDMVAQDSWPAWNPLGDLGRKQSIVWWQGTHGLFAPCQGRPE